MLYVCSARMCDLLVSLTLCIFKVRVAQSHTNNFFEGEMQVCDDDASFPGSSINTYSVDSCPRKRSMW